MTLLIILTNRSEAEIYRKYPSLQNGVKVIKNDIFFDGDISKYYELEFEEQLPSKFDRNTILKEWVGINVLNENFTSNEIKINIYIEYIKKIYITKVINLEKALLYKKILVSNEGLLFCFYEGYLDILDRKGNLITKISHDKSDDENALLYENENWIEIGVRGFFNKNNYKYYSPTKYGNEDIYKYSIDENNLYLYFETGSPFYEANENKIIVIDKNGKAKSLSENQIKSKYFKNNWSVDEVTFVESKNGLGLIKAVFNEFENGYFEFGTLLLDSKYNLIERFDSLRPSDIKIIKSIDDSTYIFEFTKEISKWGLNIRKGFYVYKIGDGLFNETPFKELVSLGFNIYWGKHHNGEEFFLTTQGIFDNNKNIILKRQTNKYEEHLNKSNYASEGKRIELSFYKFRNMFNITRNGIKYNVKPLSTFYTLSNNNTLVDYKIISTSYSDKYITIDSKEGKSKVIANNETYYLGEYISKNNNSWEYDLGEYHFADTTILISNHGLEFYPASFSAVKIYDDIEFVYKGDNKYQIVIHDTDIDILTNHKPLLIDLPSSTGVDRIIKHGNMLITEIDGSYEVSDNQNVKLEKIDKYTLLSYNNNTFIIDGMKVISKLGPLISSNIKESYLPYSINKTIDTTFVVFENKIFFCDSVISSKNHIQLYTGKMNELHRKNVILKNVELYKEIDDSTYYYKLVSDKYNTFIYGDYKFDDIVEYYINEDVYNLKQSNNKYSFIYKGFVFQDYISYESYGNEVLSFLNEKKYDLLFKGDLVNNVDSIKQIRSDIFSYYKDKKYYLKASFDLINNTSSSVDYDLVNEKYLIKYDKKSFIYDIDSDKKIFTSKNRIINKFPLFIDPGNLFNLSNIRLFNVYENSLNEYKRIKLTSYLEHPIVETLRSEANGIGISDSKIDNNNALIIGEDNGKYWAMIDHDTIYHQYKDFADIIDMKEFGIKLFVDDINIHYQRVIYSNRSLHDKGFLIKGSKNKDKFIETDLNELPFSLILEKNLGAIKDIDSDLEEEYKFGNGKIFLAITELDGETEHYVLSVLFSNPEFSYCVTLMMSFDEDLIDDKIEEIDEYIDSVEYKIIDHDFITQFIDRFNESK